MGRRWEWQQSASPRGVTGRAPTAGRARRWCLPETDGRRALAMRAQPARSRRPRQRGTGASTSAWVISSLGRGRPASSARWRNRGALSPPSAHPDSPPAGTRPRFRSQDRVAPATVWACARGPGGCRSPGPTWGCPASAGPRGCRRSRGRWPLRWARRSGVRSWRSAAILTAALVSIRVGRVCVPTFRRTSTSPPSSWSSRVSSGRLGGASCLLICDEGRLRGSTDTLPAGITHAAGDTALVAGTVTTVNIRPCEESRVGGVRSRPSGRSASPER